MNARGIHWIICFAIPFRVASAEARSNGNPLQKTVEFLTRLQKSIISDSTKEGDAYKKYFDWCSEAVLTVNQQIKEFSRTAANLNAEIQEASSDFDDAVTRVDELTKRRSENDATMKEAKNVRAKEVADFDATEAKLMETMDMLGKAIGILEKNAQTNVDAAPEASLVQQAAVGIPAEVVQTLAVVIDAEGLDVESKAKLTSLLQQGADADSDSLGAPDGDEAYKAHSSSITEVMTNLRNKASDELRESRAAEAKAQHNFEMKVQSINYENENAKEDLEKAQKDKAEASEREATAQGALKQTMRQLEGAKASKKKVQVSCMQTAADHEASIKSRDEELSKLKEALAIIESTVGGAAERTYSFVQVSAGASSVFGVGEKMAGKEVVSIVRRLATEQHSSRLANLASRMSAAMKYRSSDGADPFKKVKGLLENMIAKLTQEASADLKEKEYCDHEMKKTQTRQENLQDDVADLKVKIDKAISDSTTLKREVKDVTRELADLAEEQAEMDKARSAMHKVYLETKDDLQKGLNGLHTAMRVLKEYYGSDSSGATLVQTSENAESEVDQPAVDNHEKATTAGASIIGLLETIESDFAKNLARVETEEDSQAAEYEKLTEENKLAKVTKDKGVEFKTKSFTQLDKTISQLSSDMSTSKDELQAVDDYWKKIHERCIGKKEKFSARKAKRKAEIKGLQEAKAMLEGTNTMSALLQQRTSFLRKQK